MSNNTELGKNMIMITSAFRGAQSFNLVPATESCPYVECLFDPSTRILAVITKTMKGSFHMVPKVDDNGEPQRLKFPNKETGKTVKEQRVMCDTFSEFYISNPKEIEEFIKCFAINSDTYSYKSYLKEQKEKPKSKIITSV
jgi:hypothetical protein